MAFVLAAASAGVGAGAGASESQASREYAVKAAFLLNFAQFVEWPAEAFASPDAPLRIGVLGEDPFAGALDATVAGETVREHPIEVERADDPHALADCHLVFVAASEERRIDEVIAALGDRPILTVGDMEDFARRGGVLNFLIDERKIRFAINPTAAKAGGLQINAQLLNLAKLVDADHGR